MNTRTVRRLEALEEKREEESRRIKGCFLAGLQLVLEAMEIEERGGAKTFMEEDILDRGTQIRELFQEMVWRKAEIEGKLPEYEAAFADRETTKAYFVDWAKELEARRNAVA